MSMGKRLADFAAVGEKPPTTYALATITNG
jgi:hypothetical protein